MIEIIQSVRVSIHAFFHKFRFAQTVLYLDDIKVQKLTKQLSMLVLHKSDSPYASSFLKVPQTLLDQSHDIRVGFDKVGSILFVVCSLLLDFQLQAKRVDACEVAFEQV